MARTDGDTWDLASSVGATATGVAASRALASKQPNPLINDPFADALVKAVGLELLQPNGGRRTGVGDDPLFNRQRMCEQIAVRTRFFDDFFTGADIGGYPAGGHPGLRARHPRLPAAMAAGCGGVRDRPATGHRVQDPACWPSLGANAAADRRTVAIDLRDDWPTALRDSGFDPTRPTAWIAEGLLIYLPPDAQDRLFDNITALSAPGSRLATEHMDIQGSPDEWTEKLNERSRRMGSNIDLAELVLYG